MDNPINASSSQHPRPAIALSYESADIRQRNGPRPWWIWAVVIVYLILLAGVAFMPALITSSISSETLIAAIPIGALFLSGWCLMLIPVRKVRRRLVTRRTIWIPVIASGLLFGALVVGGAIALAELIEIDVDSTTLWIIADGALSMWAVWIIIFAIIAWGDGANIVGIGMKLHRILIAGSVLELLIAVPVHLVVRRRTQCCAGLYTGVGICVGVSIMIVSFGPGVLLLFYRRRREITGLVPRRQANHLSAPST